MPDTIQFSSTDSLIPSHRSILRLAVPVMLSNVSTPLIGVVDTAIVGRIPDAAYIGAVAVASLVFTFLFWAFGFLRMGTTGLTAQASGAGDGAEVIASLGRALLVAAAAGLLLIALQWPLRELAFALLHGSDRVESLARGYFDIRIWSAPAALANYALLGWFVGLGRTDVGFVLQLILNISNIVLDVVFVLGLGWGVRGVALGTLLAEFIAAISGIVIALIYARHRFPKLDLIQVFDVQRLKRTITVNADIMVRSLALMLAFIWFMAQGAQQGDVILAANAVLMQFIGVSAYFLDGLAFSAETLVGRAIGAGHREALAISIRRTTIWAAAIALLLSAAIAVFGERGIAVLTADPNARATADTYLMWAAIGPVLGVWAFQLDGVFIGATRTAEMRNAMLLSLVIYFIAWKLTLPLGNTGLWMTLCVHYIARAVTLLYYYPRLISSVTGSSQAEPAIS
jgi:MATE family multidrug resistance protein